MLTDVYKDNVAPFRADRLDREDDFVGARGRAKLDLSKPLPLGVCFLIWGALALAGWGLVYVGVHFMLGVGTAL